MCATLTLIERLSYRIVNGTRRSHATAIAIALAAWFRSQALRVGAHVDEMTRENSDRIFDDNASVDNARLASTLMLAYLSGLIWSSLRYNLDRTYDETSITVVLYRQRVYELIRLLNNTTKYDLQDVLMGANESALTSVQTVKAIKQLFVSYETQRSPPVGAYESNRAFNSGSYQAIVDTGVRYDKLWLTAGDDRVEQECLDNAAQGWIGLSVVYNDGVRYPPAHVGCRCVLDFRKA